MLIIQNWGPLFFMVGRISPLVFQNPPVIPCQEVEKKGPPKGRTSGGVGSNACSKGIWKTKANGVTQKVR